MDYKQKDHTDEGYVIFARATYKSSSTWLALNPIQKVVMMTLIMMANHRDSKWWDDYKKEWVEVKRGQLITSLDKLRQASGKGVTTQNIRTALSNLEKMGFLTNKSTKHYRLITVVNYGLYQSPDNYLTKQSTNAQQSPNKALTINKNDKNGKNDNKYIYSIFDYWNLQKIIVHRSLTNKLSGHINARISEGYSEGDIKSAISNYAAVLKGDEYYWTHTWTLQEFITRGLDKFVPGNFRADSYLVKKGVTDGSAGSNTSENDAKSSKYAGHIRNYK